jgi:two-component system response regulator AlgR
VNAIDYLLKPIRRERLLMALGKTRAAPPVSRDAPGGGGELAAPPPLRPRARQDPPGAARRHPLPARGAQVRDRPDREREFLVEESLTKLEEEFAEAFVRIHRNCLVARQAIAGFERNAEESESGWAVVIRATGEKLPVSRRQQHVVKQFR